MKISAIKPYVTKLGVRNQLLLKVETEEGIYGWGESGLSYREKAVLGAIDHYSRFLIGRDPMQCGALWQEMYRSQYFEGGRVLTAAISALDIAFHDIKGKALGVPVYQLLGGRQRERVPAFATTSAEPGPEMVEQALLLKDQGWRCIRMIATGQENSDRFEPRESIATTAEWVTRVREAVGNEITLGVEYHHRLSVAEAASFCQKLPRGTLDFIEEPIRDETPGAYEALRRMTEIPFAIGEEFSSKWQFLPYVERDLLQFCRIDICNVGGFTEAMKIAGWCEAHYVDLMPHAPLGAVCTAASVHLAAAVANFAWLECRNSPTEQLGFGDPATYPKQIGMDGAFYRVPDEPGLGVDVNESLLQASSFEYSEPPHLRRDDGSFTNW
ncbi:MULTISPECIES: mandelate racemase/muconate lactonizing enzyme family protein [unclassified Rhizobium]|uniref:mandelate racemase/muconate lactonizing enzyme family protein n=1 Tax=unclassified Rhizobium TaxID=2613769 RepID=UPI001AEAD826|nr:MULTISPECIES: mandelate racemase/muconate lactonizing enzyme family protein [unclassified Rhizobium]MBP2459867.1 galactonate dehydratase [Rhizobium sp. PvP014]MBP2531226.1 galactonate dehydratase [Rhizobium sp. PvP099]